MQPLDSVAHHPVICMCLYCSTHEPGYTPPMFTKEEREYTRIKQTHSMDIEYNIIQSNLA
jgi:hypothetical protein